MNREIGSDFWEISLEDKINNVFWWESEKYKTKYFISGRNALLGLCRLLESSKKRVILPGYTCSTVIDPFIQEKWKIEYYDINIDLSINIASLEKLIKEFKPTAILLHAYFGFKFKNNIEKILKLAKDNHIFIIEDLTQNLLSGEKNIEANFYISSMRKFLAVPDGGILISNEEIMLECCEEKKQLIELSNKAFELKKVYMNTNDKETKKRFRELYVECHNILALNDELVNVSQQTLEIYKKTDLKKIKQKRLKNFNLLCERLKTNKKIRLIYKRARDTVIPLYLPLYVLNNEREVLQKYLADNNIYCPIIWPRYNIIPQMSKETEYIYDNILCIPIDQRYDDKDMEYIAQKITEFERRGAR